MTLTHRRLGVQQIFSAPSAYPRDSFPARGEKFQKIILADPPENGALFGGSGAISRAPGAFFDPPKTPETWNRPSFCPFLTRNDPQRPRTCSKRPRLCARCGVFCPFLPGSSLGGKKMGLRPETLGKAGKAGSPESKVGQRPFKVSPAFRLRRGFRRRPLGLGRRRGYGPHDGGQVGGQDGGQALDLRLWTAFRAVGGEKERGRKATYGKVIMCPPN